jgi:hypothetical protein
MHIKSLLAAIVCALAVMAMGAGSALAGEVVGPPGTVGVVGSGSQTATAAPAHANSICAFSGLNDFINGQTTRITQTPKDGPPGTPGQVCRGGSNPDNPPSP